MASASQIIKKKRDGGELSQDEIHQFIQGVTDGTIPDYQATAFLMAVFFQGMTPRETVHLTQAMLASGERYELETPIHSNPLHSKYVDKHSTGGVGDKVSIVLAPLAVACGLKVPMMSGRGLGFSGGTLDKLESIPGFQTQLTREKFMELMDSVGCAMIGQSEKIAPADKRLYALRDVTATVECVPLIVSSILSKKVAEGARALVLDVKVGSGAFMKTKDEAKTLARTLVAVARKMDLPCRALLTNMNQPLGYAVGNSLEIKECIEILRNQKSSALSSADLKELTVQLCAHMLELGGKVKSLAEGRKLAHRKLLDGSAWRVFQTMVKAQGGNLESVSKSPFLAHVAERQVTWSSLKSGYISKINTEVIGKILIGLGGGRQKASDLVDPSVGLVFHKKLGSKVQAKEPIVTVHAQSKTDLTELEQQFQDSIEIVAARKPVSKLIFEIM